MQGNVFTPESSRPGSVNCSRFQMRLKKVLVLLMLAAAASLWAQDGKFSQKLQWRADKNALYYNVELQTVKTGKSSMIKTEKNSIELSLQPGKYRYRVYVYDFLGRQSSVNSWTDFEILKASQPVITAIEKEVTLPADSDLFDIKLDVSGVSAKSTVTLINTQTGHSVAGSLFLKGGSKVQSETERAEKARFPYVRAGSWKIKITNPSGYASESLPFAIVDAGKNQFALREKELLAENAKALEEEKARLAEELKKMQEAAAAEEKRLAEQKAAQKKEKEAEPPVSEKQEKAVRSFLKESTGKDVTISAIGRGHSEFGFYLTDYVPRDRMENHSYNFMGLGLSYAWHFNQKKRLHAGVCLHADATTVMANLDYIEEWYAAGAFGGIFVQASLTDFFSIVPQAETGFQIDFVRSSKTSNTYYTSPAVQAGLEFKLSPQNIGLDGLSIAAAPYYRFALEKNGDIAHYIGGRLSFLYHIGKKTRVDTSPWAPSSASADSSPSREKE